MTLAGRQRYSVIRHLAWSIWLNHDPESCIVTVFAEFMAAYDVLKEALPDADIQYGTREGLSKYIRADVEREAIRIL